MTANKSATVSKAEIISASGKNKGCVFGGEKETRSGAGQ